MKETVAYQMPNQLRDLFVTICIFGVPKDARKLFDENILHLSEDFLQRHPQDIAINLALFAINRGLANYGKNVKDFKLPQLNEALIAAHIHETFENKIEPSRQEYTTEAEKREALLNEGQKAAYSTIMEAINNDKIQQRQFFLDGPVGTGKTFLYNTASQTVNNHTFF